MFWLILAEIGLIILSYVLANRARVEGSRRAKCTRRKSPQAPPIPVAFGKVKLEPIITEFSVPAMKWSDGSGGVLGYRYVVTYMGLLCGGRSTSVGDIIFDETKRLSAQATQHLVADPVQRSELSTATPPRHDGSDGGAPRGRVRDAVGQARPTRRSTCPFIFGGYGRRRRRRDSTVFRTMNNPQFEPVPRPRADRRLVSLPPRPSTTQFTGSVETSSRRWMTCASSVAFRQDISCDDVYDDERARGGSAIRTTATST
jgi:hypothetical protein